MQSKKFQVHTGPDGLLKLEVPVGQSNADFEVLVIVQPIPVEATTHTLIPTNNIKTPQDLG
jgi:hypothetical protein